MISSKPFALLTTAAVLGLTVVALASCGGSNSKPIASSPPPKTASGRPATIGVENSNLGKILVDAQGRTLYLFTKDSGTTSQCTGACASAWPPVRATGKPTVGSGANASMVGTTPRSDGKPQVTYNGHPVYLYQGDNSQGDTNGQGLNAFGGGWFAVSPAGQQVSGTGSNTGGGSSPY
jgi:predicted lipoprotein with Yx(FWY)xxD motif